MGKEKPRKVQGPGHKYRTPGMRNRLINQVQALKKDLAKIYQAIDDLSEWKTVGIADIRVRKIWGARPKKVIDQLYWMKGIIDEANTELALIVSERETAQASASSTLQDLDSDAVPEGFWDPTPAEDLDLDNVPDGFWDPVPTSSGSNPADTTIESRDFESESAATANLQQKPKNSPTYAAVAASATNSAAAAAADVTAAVHNEKEDYPALSTAAARRVTRQISVKPKPQRGGLCVVTLLEI